MSLNIKDEKTDALARQLARLTNRSITEAVRDALEEQVQREERKRNAAKLSEELLEIGRKFVREFPKGDATSLDHDELFYDELGLPK